MAVLFAQLWGEKEKSSVAEPLLPGNYDLLRELNRDSPVKNVQILYVVMPMITDVVQRREYPATMEGPRGLEPILTLARPDLYPALFQAQYWSDDSHLNEAGAAMASGLLAEQIKAWYAANPEPARCGG